MFQLDPVLVIVLFERRYDVDHKFRDRNIFSFAEIEAAAFHLGQQ